MAVIDTKVKLHVSTHFELKIQSANFESDFKPKSVVWEENLKSKGIEKSSFLV